VNFTFTFTFTPAPQGCGKACVMVSHIYFIAKNGEKETTANMRLHQ